MFGAVGQKKRVQQKTFIDFRGPIMRLALQELIGKISLFVRYWAGNVLVTDGGSATMAVTVPSTGDRFLAVSQNKLVRM